MPPLAIQQRDADITSTSEVSPPQSIVHQGVWFKVMKCSVVDLERPSRSTIKIYKVLRLKILREIIFNMLHTSIKFLDFEKNTIALRDS
ncbi:hypothetical protein M378DRAFT_12829 [Amanita muscaria Koide BX008]|uniref:Uncharacterized protein n=1 Tax=Amanita muscaria (strain Koide BX008) TaxID=946122 RepID=A0A0C2X071_AMAMK|nr:hypothetical protein M378DRAFT_12829 [Amanita muscaria Koide BX008]